jgi:cysteine desulfurase
VYNVSNISFDGIYNDVMIEALDNICVSSGSACTSAIMKPSYVLKALGLSETENFGSLRFSLGKFNTVEEIKLVVSVLKEKIQEFRRSS